MVSVRDSDDIVEKSTELVLIASWRRVIYESAGMNKLTFIIMTWLLILLCVLSFNIAFRVILLMPILVS